MKTNRLSLLFLCLLIISFMNSLYAEEKLSWSPQQATGEPDTHKAGDIKTAWATLEQNKGDEWLKLEYENPVEVKTVRIYETCNPGAISKVTAFTIDGTETLIWEGTEPVREAPCVFEVNAPENIVSNSIKIYLDTKRVNGWNEIDAVQLVDRHGAGQWAVKAEASSTFAERYQKRETPEPTYENLPPSVVETIPRAGELNVDPSMREISVTFSKDMMTEKMWAFCQVSGDTFPKRIEGEEIYYLSDKRTCVMPVILEPDKTYIIWINKGRFNSFRDTSNNPAVPYLLVFRTRGE